MIFNVLFCLFIFVTRIIQTYTMIIYTLHGGSWEEIPNEHYVNLAMYWMEPVFFFIDALVLIIALMRIYCTFKSEK